LQSLSTLLIVTLLATSEANVYDPSLRATTIDGDDMSMDELQGKVTLFVNVASQ